MYSFFLSILLILIGFSFSSTKPSQNCSCFIYEQISKSLNIKINIGLPDLLARLLNTNLNIVAWFYIIVRRCVITCMSSPGSRISNHYKYSYYLHNEPAAVYNFLFMFTHGNDSSQIFMG